jgi:hypothetical protein
MQKVAVVGIFCGDSRSPAEIRLSIREALDDSKLVSLNFSSSSDVLQTLRTIISPGYGQNASASALAAPCSLQQGNGTLLPKHFEPHAAFTVAADARSPPFNTSSHAEYQSPPPSPRSTQSRVTYASYELCPPANPAVAEAAVEASPMHSSSSMSASDCASAATSALCFETNAGSMSQSQQQTAHDVASDPAAAIDAMQRSDFSQGIIALNLSGCHPLDAHSLTCAATLLSALNLHTIILDGCGIDDIGAAALAATFASYPSLLTLNLRHNAITDAGAKRLLSAAQLHPQLQTIVCDGCRVSVRLQKLLRDVSKKNRAAAVAPLSPTCLQLQPPVSESKLSDKGRASKRAQRQHSIFSFARSSIVAASPPSAHTLPHHASSFVSFVARGHHTSISSSTSVPSSPAKFSVTPKRFSTPTGKTTRCSLAREFGLLPKPTHAHKYTPPSCPVVDDDSEFINNFIQSRRYAGSVDRGSSQPSAPAAVAATSDGNDSRSFGISDLLDACVSMQDHAGIPVPLHFTRNTPLHEIRAFMRRETAKREKASPLRLLHDHRNLTERNTSPSPESPVVVPAVSKDLRRPRAEKKAMPQATTTAAALLGRSEEQEQVQDDERLSRICAVGIVSSDITPHSNNILTQMVPFSDFDVEEQSPLSDAHDEQHANARYHVLSLESQPPGLSSTTMPGERCSPPSLSPALSPSAADTFSSLQTISDLSFCSSSQHAAAAELMASQQYEVPEQQEHGREVELDCMIDDSSVWAKSTAILIQTALQGTP